MCFGIDHVASIIHIPVNSPDVVGGRLVSSISLPTRIPEQSSCYVATADCKDTGAYYCVGGVISPTVLQGDTITHKEF